MTRRLLLVLVAMVWAACTEKTPPQAPPPPPPTPVVDAAPVEKPKPPRVDPTPALQVLFPAGPPKAPSPYETLMPGVTEDQVKKSHGVLLGKAKPLAGASESSAAIILDAGTQKVRYLRFELPPEAETVLTKAWGTGRVAKRNGRKAATFWFTETHQFILLQQGVRFRLEVWSYTPIERLLGATSADIGGLVGGSLAKFKTRFAGARWKEDGEKTTFVLPPQRFYTRVLPVHLTITKKRVTRADYRVALGAYAEQVAESKKVLEAWGPAQKGGKLNRFFKKGRTGLEVRRTRGNRPIFQITVKVPKKK